MSSLLFEATGFLDKYLISGALSSASGDALRPLLQDIVNEAWKGNPVIPPPFVLLAEGVAQGQVDPAKARAWALEQGYDKAQFDALVNIANTGPPIGQALELLRRIDPSTGQSVWTPEQFRTALNRQGIERTWWDGLAVLATRLLDPADLARGIHKGLIPEQGLLAVPAPEGVGKVPAYPVYPIDGIATAAGFGYTRDDLGVLVGLQGNPMGAHEAAQAQFRGVIEPVDYDRAIAEGNTRNEWGDAIREQSRAIPSPTNYVEGGIRTRITRDEMYAGAARHGMTHADTDLLYAIHGRPATPHQVFIGLRRGGAYDGPIDQIDPAILQSMRDANLRPEYYNLVAAGLEVYPSTFALRGLAQAGTISETDTARILSYEGWNAELGAEVAKVWAGGTATAKPKTLTRADVRAAWREGHLTDAEALARLEAENLSAADALLVLNTWKSAKANTPASSQP